MTLFYTLTIGIWLWFSVSTVGDSRAAFGIVGPPFVAGAWFVTVLLLRRASRRLRGEPAASWWRVAAWTAGTIAIISIVFAANRIGDTLFFVPFLSATVMGGLAIVFAFLVESVVRWLRLRREPVRVPADAQALTSALAPMLVIAAALFAPWLVRLGGGWELVLSGRGAAGILYIGMVPLLPARRPSSPGAGPRAGTTSVLDVRPRRGAAALVLIAAPC